MMLRALKHSSFRPGRRISGFLSIIQQKSLLTCQSACFSYHKRQRLAFVSTHEISFHNRRCLSTSASTNDESFFTKFIDGPSIQLGAGKLANQTHSSIVGTSGSTVLLTTVARQPSTSDGSFLTVDYRQRHHGVGEIPDVRSRKDNTIMSPAEILAARAIDRALRPLLPNDTDDEALHFHAHCSVQACQLWPDEPVEMNSQIPSISGHPVALALNTATAALAPHLTEPVAATVLALMPDGTLVQDPSPWQVQHSHGELLYAGTRQHTIMMEWSSHESATGLPEHVWGDLLEIAHASIQPLLDNIEELQDIRQQPTTPDKSSKITLEEEARLRESLGLPAIEESSPVEPETISLPDGLTRQQRLLHAIDYCQSHLGDAPQRLFGYNGPETTVKEQAPDLVYIHEDGQDLLSKSTRGRREQVVQKEIARLVKEYLDQELGARLREGDGNEEYDWLHTQVTDRILRKALWKTATQHGSRADGRGMPGTGWKTVRPIAVRVPALPEAVHGSALFARGDTQVLCTCTLGAPRDGAPLTDPYQPTTNPKVVPDTQTNASGYYESLPVGSLRFLRTQEALVSDLNSRNVKADKERTGDSGSLAEVQRAFLQYDFPAYSTGEVPVGNMAHKRRSIGHGALAERAILPTLPDSHDFPYAIRMTSEVTDSNGSSSMASVCGAVLALLDAGVPIQNPVAGVSVGLAMNDINEEHGLLLDITGTEDHYGAMDFKIAGTRDGVTALQLDVKKPLSREVLVDALNLARSGRCVILDEMEAQCKQSLGGLKARAQPKESAPCVEVVRFDPQRKRDLIGPGGVILRQLEDRYGVSLDLTQEGRCLLYGANRELVSKAKFTVMDLVADVVKGEVYEGTIIEIKDFGAIVELLRNKEGLLHVSELTDEEEAREHPNGTAGFVRQYMRVGQRLEVLCTDVDPVQGSIKLSRKALLTRQRSLHKS